MNCSRTGARPPIALATLTAATVKSLHALARRPKLPPDTSVCSLTLSIGRPAALAANMWSKVGNWCPDHVSSMPSCSQATQFIGSIVAWARNGNSYTASIVLTGRRRGGRRRRLGERRARLRGLRAIAGQQRFRIEVLARRLVPLHLERAPALQRGPRARGDDGHAFGHFDDVGDALHLLRVGGIEGHELGAEATAATRSPR